MTNVHGTQGSLTADMKAEIRKEAISQIAKWAIGAIVLLLGLAVTGWYFVLKQKLDAYIESKGVIPPSTVAAFDRTDCPPGWDPFKDGIGRTIIGAGRGDDGLTPRRFRSTHDVEAVTLTDKNVPLHQHDIFIGVTTPTSWGTGPAKSAVYGAGVSTFSTALSGPYGKSPPDPISIMPPYIALTLCFKK